MLANETTFSVVTNPILKNSRGLLDYLRRGVPNRVEANCLAPLSREHMASSRPDLMPNFPPEGHDTQEAQENQKVVHGTKRRKYERKTKRFLWSDDLHQLFIAAIFDSKYSVSRNIMPD